MTLSVRFRDRDFNETLSLAGITAAAQRLSWNAQGGPEGAALTVSGAELALWQLGGILRYAVEVVNERGEAIWWGYVAGVEFQKGAIRFGLWLDRMHNSVAVAWSSADGETGRTVFLADAESVATYGTKQLLVSADNMTTAAAAQRRAAELNRRRLPIASPPASTGGGAGTGATVTLSCGGWFETLDWRYYSRGEGLLEFLGSSETPQKIGLGFTGSGVGFRAGARSVVSLGARLGHFQKGDQLRVSGSASNDGTYTVERDTDQEAATYTAGTLSFDATMQEVRDSAHGLAAFDTGETILVAGSTSNDGAYTIEKANHKEAASHTDANFAFNAATKIINNWAYGLGVFGPGDLLVVSGSTSNNGYYHVKSGSSDGSALTVEEALTDEAAGATVTASRIQWLAVAEATVDEAAGATVTISRGHQIVVEEAVVTEAPGASITVTGLGTHVAQSLQVASAAAWTVATASVKVRRVGSPADLLVIALYNDSAGSPGTVLDYATIAGSALSAESDWVTVDLANTQSLAPGTTYWLVVSRNGAISPTDYYEVSVDEDLGYAPEVLKLYDGAAWVSRSVAAHLPFRLTGLEDTNVQMEQLVTTAGEFIERVEVAASGVETNQWRYGDNTALVELLALLNLGTSNDLRMLATVTRERTLIVSEEPTKPDPIIYFQRADGMLVDRHNQPLLEVYPPVGQWVDLKDVIPDAVQVSELLRPGPYVLERAEYNVAQQGWRLDARDSLDVWEMTGIGEG